MIDKAIQIRPGMRVRHVEGRTEKTIISVGGEGRDVITNLGVWLGEEAAFRAHHELVDPPVSSEPARQACLDAAKQPERRVERRLAVGWEVSHDDIQYGCTARGHVGLRLDSACPWIKQSTGDGACLACAESMGVFQDSAGAATAVHAGQQLVKSRMEPGTTAPATYSCPCARMNLRYLSGDPVCYCTERPKPARVVGRYVTYEMRMRDMVALAANTGVATGLSMEARPKTRTEIACERAARRYGSTSDKWPSGA